ncbi:tetratricopeptide repeat protein [Pseudacidovorax sp. RU35E]|uniref:tetratricopeptide repeat protein n=1 Tax=Pseudacidovorax sp. RU35E TaxID=1907403 RepID=UPI000953A0B0|nr:tetratricopeptide repeat protein [Pseudacidovorax sp. RU35E]SIQ60760.1 Sel1 repeat-containing protein [Pseudacidovorax sp. RU35E]
MALPGLFARCPAGRGLLLAAVLGIQAGGAAVAAPAAAEAAYERSRHYRGLSGEVVDPLRARDELLRAASAQHLAAQVDLGFLYLNGMGPVGKDLDAAFRWLSLAARRGAPAAACVLGDFFRQGLGGAPRDPAQAVRWDRRMAGSNEACAPRAQFELYRAYWTGEGVARHVPTAMRWLKMSAEAGNPRAQRALGRAYDRGEGVSRDDGLARLWLRKSREGIAPHDDHDHDLPSLAGPRLFEKLAPFYPGRATNLAATP